MFSKRRMCPTFSILPLLFLSLALLHLPSRGSGFLSFTFNESQSTRQTEEAAREHSPHPRAGQFRKQQQVPNSLLICLITLTKPLIQRSVRYSVWIWHSVTYRIKNNPRRLFHIRVGPTGRPAYPQCWPVTQHIVLLVKLVKRLSGVHQHSNNR